MLPKGAEFKGAYAGKPPVTGRGTNTFQGHILVGIVGLWAQPTLKAGASQLLYVSVSVNVELLPSAEHVGAKL
jgi:hypothetical protein